MIGRGVDQILPSPCPPKLYEEYVSSAQEYVRLAEAASGPIPRPVDPSYIWGDALAELEAHAPDARIVNLETSVTRSETAEHKAINYRVSPQNAECLRAAGIDCCALANNHVLDWGPSRPPRDARRARASEYRRRRRRTHRSAKRSGRRSWTSQERAEWSCCPSPCPTAERPWSGRRRRRRPASIFCPTFLRKAPPSPAIWRGTRRGAKIFW